MSSDRRMPVEYRVSKIARSRTPDLPVHLGLCHHRCNVSAARMCAGSFRCTRGSSSSEAGFQRMWFSRASQRKNARKRDQPLLLGREGERLAVLFSVVVEVPPVTLQDRPGDILGALDSPLISNSG